jgi:hypothetical protein
MKLLEVQTSLLPVSLINDVHKLTLALLPRSERSSSTNYSDKNMRSISPFLVKMKSKDSSRQEPSITTRLSRLTLVNGFKSIVKRIASPGKSTSKT